MEKRMVSYECTCITDVAHSHTVEGSTARRRGQHSFDDPSVGEAGRNIKSTENININAFATDLQDAVLGCLWGMVIGDTLAVPMHWYYSWDTAQEHQKAYYDGGLVAKINKIQEDALRSGGQADYSKLYVGVHPDVASQHPDSHKYFSRVDPHELKNAWDGVNDKYKDTLLAEDKPETPFWDSEKIARYLTPGQHYHRGLPAGDSTLTTRLSTQIAASCVASKGLDACDWFARYLRFLGRGGPHNGDLWVDETHRILFKNINRGASPTECGQTDCCLSGLVLSSPLCLAYVGDRDAAEVAIRSALQYTHKSEDMMLQTLYWTDLLGSLLATVLGIGAEAGGESSSPEERQRDVAAQAEKVLKTIQQLTRSFSHDKVDLQAIEALGLPDNEAFHGSRAVFSVR